ncbi:MAG: hypothetical protein JSS32_04370 [Verrucomicrobia bacterium]|nr:hypothetical protein [Verrucomicrobiota bacterium]
MNNLNNYFNQQLESFNQINAAVREIEERVATTYRLARNFTPAQLSQFNAETLTSIRSVLQTSQALQSQYQESSFPWNEMAQRIDRLETTSNLLRRIQNVYHPPIISREGVPDFPKQHSEEEIQKLDYDLEKYIRQVNFEVGPPLLEAEPVAVEPYQSHRNSGLPCVFFMCTFAVLVMALLTSLAPNRQ